MSKFIGSFLLEKSENFEEFMKYLGVGIIQRKLANTTTPTCTFSENDGVYTFLTSSIVKSFEVKFKLGEEFDEVSTDGRQCKTIFSKEGDDTLVQVQKAVKGKDTTITRIFTDKDLTTICECEGIKSTRIYKKI